MTDLSGQYLGRYYLSERLGEGGMAVVYKAYDTRLERDVAIKIIRSGAFPTDALKEVLKRFEREAKSLAKLSHPNIVKVYDYGEHEGEPYLVMEYLPGGTLKKMLGKPVPWQDAVRLVLPVARGMAYAHQRGILHRDIKPANVLITDGGEPMLSDFGIAKLFEGEQTTALTGSGMAIGTPEYMAPEQWTGITSPHSDLYSLGIVLYELVTGRKPYVADTPAAILIKQATEPLPSPSKFAVDLPEELEHALVKALARESQDRYKDVYAFIGALENLHERGPAIPPEQKRVEETYKVPSQKPTTPVSTKTLRPDDSETVRPLEATENAEQEKAKRNAAEKAKRERAERQVARRTAMVKAVSNLFTTLKSSLPKAKPTLKAIGIIGMLIVFFWVGSWGVPRLASLVPTVHASLIPTLRPSEIVTFTVSPQPPTKTQTTTPTKNPTPTSVISIPTSVYVEGVSYFDQDFENADIISGWAFSSYPSTTYPRKYWTIEVDTDGNHVLAGNAPTNTELSILTGSSQWGDYAFEFRAKVMRDSEGEDSPSFGASVRASNDINDNQVRYVYGLGFGRWWFLGRETCRSGAGCSFSHLVNGQHKIITLSKWYVVRIECYGPEIIVYVDGKLLHKVKDNASLRGAVNLSVPSGAEVYFDDIRVIKLVERLKD